MMLARQAYAYGPQSEYLDEAECIGFTRHGDTRVSGGAGLAVLMTSRSGCVAARTKWMCVGYQHAGEMWTDLLGEVPGTVLIDVDGWGEFTAPSRGVSVWVDVAAEGRAEMECFTL